MPTLCAAAGARPPAGLPGFDLAPLLNDRPVDSWREHIFGFSTGAAPAIFHLQHSVRDSRWKLISNPIEGKENFSARAYLEGFNSHYAGGTRPIELVTASEKIKEGYARFLNPPRWELYDLEKDPYEWYNLAEDPDHTATRDRMIAILEKWQRDTRDPFANQKWLKEFADHQLKMQDLSYRKNSEFKWPYLEKFESFVYPEKN